VLALTATATPVVQEDIAAQLGLDGPQFIQGFRRDNIAIEVVAVAQGNRAGATIELLADPARRPAIVYTPTRRESESLAVLLGIRFPAAAYHAGLDAKRRSEVQTAFLSSRLEVIVATIAFGMGIDKPNIRTVIHTALPGSVEAYYQEIGRAGRDGLPARAILMHSYADRRTHDYFFERDYPESAVLQRLFHQLRAEPEPKEVLALRVRMDRDLFNTALEKLWTHGGALIDFADNVARGAASWQQSYEFQREQKLAQLEQMLRYAGSSQCRMMAIVRHFGDRAGARTLCGICDFCAPAQCVAQTCRPATAEETAIAYRVLQTLQKGPLATGRLHIEAGGESAIDRNSFERVLGALAQGGWIETFDTSFEKDGQRIDFRKSLLTRHGRAVQNAGELSFSIAESIDVRPRERTRTRTRKSRRKERKRTQPTAVDAGVEQSLRAWRSAEAKRLSVPAFRVLTDKTLHAIAADRPLTTNALLAIPGMGIKAVEKYGAAIFRILSQHGSTEPRA
jgi:superfamily II DNA helicase RecQ